MDFSSLTLHCCHFLYTPPTHTHRALGLSDWGEEVAIGLFAPGPLKYPMTEELTRDSLTEFIQVAYSLCTLYSLCLHDVTHVVTNKIGS